MRKDFWEKLYTPSGRACLLRQTSEYWRFNGFTSLFKGQKGIIRRKCEAVGQKDNAEKLLKKIENNGNPDCDLRAVASEIFEKNLSEKQIKNILDDVANNDDKSKLYHAKKAYGTFKETDGQLQEHYVNNNIYFVGTFVVGAAAMLTGCAFVGHATYALPSLKLTGATMMTALATFGLIAKSKQANNTADGLRKNIKTNRNKYKKDFDECLKPEQNKEYQNPSNS